jgi:ABC-type antimicrobial peptide transport system permease subunit
VIRQGILLTAIGLGAGLVFTLCITGFLRSLLYGVTPNDPWTLAAVSLLLLIVAVWASYVPARRASRVDPMTALRHE